MKKILTVCPTRQRVNICKRMLDSFLETTSECSRIIFILDFDDPTLDEYMKIFTHPRCDFIVEKIKKTTTQMYNDTFKIFNFYDFYHLSNDDFYYKTVGWDMKLSEVLIKNNGGIAYGNDLIQMNRLCTAPFISGDIVRKLGWLQMPRLTHLGGDCVWMEIGRRLNKLFYLEKVIIEHKHYQAQKSEIDEIYKKTNSHEMYEKDCKAFQEWIEEDSRVDLLSLQQSS